MTLNDTQTEENADDVDIIDGDTAEPSRTVEVEGSGSQKDKEMDREEEEEEGNEASLPVPQVSIGPDGQIILNEAR